MLGPIVSFDVLNDPKTTMLNVIVDSMDIDEACDQTVTVSVAPIVLILKPLWCSRILDWIKDASAKVKESSLAVQNVKQMLRRSARKRLVQSRQLLDDVSSTTSRLHVNLDLAFPTILFPSRILHQTAGEEGSGGPGPDRQDALSLTVLEMGHLHFSTEQPSKSMMKYAFNLQNLNLSFCPASPEWRQETQVVQNRFNAHFTVDVHLEDEVIQTKNEDEAGETLPIEANQTLPESKFRVLADIEPLELRLSTQQLHHAFAVMDTFAPLMNSTLASNKLHKLKSKQ